jgi:hypothetical protein
MHKQIARMLIIKMRLYRQISHSNKKRTCKGLDPLRVPTDRPIILDKLTEDQQIKRDRHFVQRFDEHYDNFSICLPGCECM